MRIRIAFCLLFLSLVAVPMYAATEEILMESSAPLSSPVFDSAGKRVAFVAGESGKTQVVICDLKTKNLTQVPVEKGEQVSPSFSPDGLTLFFCDNSAGNFDIKAMEIPTGKIRAVTSTSDDEFMVECARGRFAEVIENVATASYFKLFFLQGKKGSGSLCSMRADGKHNKLLDESREFLLKDNIVSEQPDGTQILKITSGEFTEMTLGVDPHKIILKDKSGLKAVNYALFANEDNTIAIDLPPRKAVELKGSGDLSRISYAPSFQHVFAFNGKETVIYNESKGSVEPFPLKNVSTISGNPINRKLAFVEKRGDKFMLIVQPCEKRELLVSNFCKAGSVFSGDALRMLLKNNFVVIPGSTKEFYQAYEHNRYGFLESYITADSVYYLFYLYYDFILKQIEKGKFREDVVRVAEAMANEAARVVKTVKKPEAKQTFKKLWMLFSLAVALEKDQMSEAEKTAGKLDREISPAVSADLKSIFEAAGPGKSEIFGKTVDFSQFKVRGHYEKEAALKSYFRIMMLFSQAPLKVFDPDTKLASTDIPTILALYYLAKTVKMEKDSALDRLEKISMPLDFMVGDTEDIGVIQLNKLFGNLKLPENRESLFDKPAIDSAFELLKGCAKPRIRPFEDVSVYFFPQRFTLDSFIMQKLVYKAVGTDDNPRKLPRLLDVMAALGSKRGEEILVTVFKDDKFLNYKKNLGEMQAYVKGIPETEWASNIYRGWLNTIRSIVSGADAPKEIFASTPEWADRMLNTALGSLTTLRHATLLYNKMGAAEAGEGGEIEDMLVRDLPDVYLDPYPSLYGNLKKLVLELYGKLTAQGYLSGPDNDPKTEEYYDPILRLTPKGLTLKFIDLLTLFEKAAIKQAKGEPLTDEEHMELWKFGPVNEHMTIALIRPDSESYNFVNEEVSIVADVFSGPGSVLEEAIGRVYDLWVLHDRGSGEKLYHGGVFSYFEFEQPIGNRLSDLDWKKMIVGKKVPPHPEWMKSFMCGDSSSVEIAKYEAEELEEQEAENAREKTEEPVEPEKPAILAEDDLKGKTEFELDCMRNEPYAKNGYKFKRKDLQEYFGKQTWYKPETSDMTAVEKKLSETEKKNCELIINFQKKRKPKK